MRDRVHVFWDNSNIFIPARTVAAEREGIGAHGGVRLHFGHLLDLAVAGRELRGGVCVGSIPSDLRSLSDRLRATGIRVELYERGRASGREQVTFLEHIRRARPLNLTHRPRAHPAATSFALAPPVAQCATEEEGAEARP